MNSFAVIVVGAGPAGLALSALLHQAGIAVALVEPQPLRRLPDVHDLRTVALTKASLAVLAELPLDWSLWRHVDYRQVRVEDADASSPLLFDAEQMGVASLGRLVENAVLQCALQNCVDALALPQYEQRLSASGIAAGQRWLDLSDGTRLQADLVVACDGAHSPLRQQLGIELWQHDYAQSALVACIQHSGDARVQAWQRFERGYPLALLPLSPLTGGPSSNLVWSLPRPRAEALLALSEAAFIDHLAPQLPAVYGRLLSVSARALYPLQARHARTYCAERAVLVGDAAHVIHPLAGQGLNLGFADVRVLVQELLRLRDRGLSLADPLGLRRYERRRRPQNQRMQQAMPWIQGLFAPEGPTGALLKGAGLAWLSRHAGLRHWLGRQALGT